ncbi:MAG: hypothetical protein ACRBBN_08910 [Methyloligellaceae bacterium]
MKYNIKLIVLGFILWVGSFFWLLYEGNEAPLSVYIYVSKTLAALEVPHKATTVEMITRTLVAVLLFVNISVWSAVLYKQTIFQWMLPKKKPAPPPAVQGAGGSIVINQHFGGAAAAKPAAPAKK